MDAAYWDCSATTPVEQAVADLVLSLMVDGFGNAGSRTHETGARAKRAVSQAREQVASVVGADPSEVIFTSGATEANNLALLGLASGPASKARRHIVSTAIEHKAVLEPLGHLERQGFEVERVAPQADGGVRADDVLSRVRPDTLLVSVMHANNETGICQPIQQLADSLADHETYLHVDAAQTFGKVLEPLTNARIDLISISGHKVFAPKGVGALIARRREWDRPPLQALQFGGGQERGLRPGTLPVPLIAGLGKAATLAVQEHPARLKRVQVLREELLEGLAQAGPVLHGDTTRALPHVLNLSFADADGEAVMLAWRDLVEVSNGSACTSSSYTPSHVLTAMGLPEENVRGAVRLSWSHLSQEVDWCEAALRVNQLRGWSPGQPPE